MRIFCNVGWRRFAETLRRQPVVRLVCSALDWVFFLFEANLKKLLETGVQFDAQLPPNFNLPQAKKTSTWWAEPNGSAGLAFHPRKFAIQALRCCRLPERCSADHR